MLSNCYPYRYKLFIKKKFRKNTLTKKHRNWDHTMKRLDQLCECLFITKSQRHKSQSNSTSCICFFT